MTFHFGLWVIERLEMAFNAQLAEFEKDEDGNVHSKFLQAISAQPYKFSANLLFWGRFFVYELEDKEVDFSLADAYVWLDTIGVNSDVMAKISEAFNESLKSHLPPAKDDEKPEVKKK